MYVGFNFIQQTYRIFRPMIRTEIIIGVKNVKASSKWYQTLLDCKDTYDGDKFEVLIDRTDDTPVLSLQRWGADEHATLINPNVKRGNGLVLYFRVDDLNEIWGKARRLYAVIEEIPAVNPKSGRQEFSLRDLDGYYVTISADAV